MTVYPTADHADFFAAYKRPAVDPMPELNPAIDHQIHQERCELERLAALAHIDRQCFELLNDLQRICHHGCSLSNADIGAIQAKLIILRINLNIRHGVNTPQLGLDSPCA
jgi:hypothetical protein